MIKPLFACLLVLSFVACRPSKQSITDYRYFDKNLDSIARTVLTLQEPVIQKHDLLTINVSSATLNQEQAMVFNLLNAGGGGGAAGGGGGGGGGAMGGVGGYLVEYDGTITLPLIGKTKAEGLTKAALTDTLVRKLEPFVKNPILNVRFLNYRILLMGEVNQRGWIYFNNEKATIVDAIGQAGGLTEQGLRDSVLLIRQQPGGQLETHRINLNDAMVFQSPYFQLQQNDIVYVMPNESKLIQFQRQNSPFFRDLPVYLGLITSVLAFGVLVISLAR